MTIWFDTEFIEDGHTIDLISIGMVRESGGAVLYLENDQCDLSRADDWVRANVLPHLQGGTARKTRAEIRDRVRDFCGDHPEIWAYYADYDWVVLCQLFGRMIDLPRGWPMYCRDLKQVAESVGLQLPAQGDEPSAPPEHHALADAMWLQRAHLWLADNADLRQAEKP